MKLHLDDQCRTPDLESFRYPPEGEDDWMTATSSAEAMEIVSLYGMPTFMQLDCDLGVKANGLTPDSSMLFIKWLYNKYPNEMPVWNIHSMNGEAAKNLQSFLEGWAKSIRCHDGLYSILASLSKEKRAAIVEMGKNVEEVSGGLDAIDHPADCGDPACKDCNDASGFPTDEWLLDHSQSVNECFHENEACPAECECWCDPCCLIQEGKVNAKTKS
jgi:hypothetical protein